MEHRNGDALSSRENVLIIMSDEHQSRALGCAGHSIVETPNLDALAASGTRFTNCWTPSPICVPARASFATGQWVHEIGAWDSVQAYTGEPTGWAHAAAAAGRDVVSFGKLHHRSAHDDDGFTERIHPMYIAGGVGWLQGLARTDPLPYPESAELAADAGVGETTYTRYDQRITDAAATWLHDRSADGAPWVAFVSLVAPHYPLSAAEEFTERYPLGDVPPPEIAPMVHTNTAVAAMQRFFNYGEYFDDTSTQVARRAYFALVSWVDHNVGRLLDALDLSGQRANTRVIYTSDHGELLGNRGLWCKSFMYEDSVAVPMIISGPGIQANTTVASNVNLVDVTPTVFDTLGAEYFGPGRSLWAESAAPSERLGFSEYHDGGSITGSFALRMGEWKFIHHVDHQPELYNVSTDVDELENLAGDPRVANEQRACAEALASVVDVRAANTGAFLSQELLMEKHGGRDRLASAFRFNHTPAPE